MLHHAPILKPEDPGYSFQQELRKRRPDLDQSCVAHLAALWEEERVLVVERMMAITGQSIGTSLHIESRPVAIFEMAKLDAWLINVIVSWKLARTAEGTLDPDRERATLTTAAAQQRIENTASILADHIWSRIVAELRRRHPLVTDASSAGPTAIIDLYKQPARVRRNHFSPVFSNRSWSDSDGRVAVFSRSVDGGITCRTMHFRQWGYAEFLYSNRLEAHLALVDEDAAASQRKLLETIPLSDLDKRRWIAFMAIQFLRTPSSLTVMSNRLRRVLPRIAPAYPTHPRALKAAYETLFTNNAVYAQFHRLLAPKRWSILRAPPTGSFIRADNPVLIEGSTKDGSWQLCYPMSSSAVFVAGPELGPRYDADFVGSISIGNDECRMLNARMAAKASKTVIAKTDADCAALRSLLGLHLGRSATDAGDGTGFWGPLA